MIIFTLVEDIIYFIFIHKHIKLAINTYLQKLLVAYLKRQKEINLFVFYD